MSTLTRRSLFKAAAASTLLKPFWNEVLAQTATPPRRLVIVMEGNGIYPKVFLSSGTQTALGSGVGNNTNFLDTYPSTALVRTGDNLATAPALAALGTGGASLINRSAVALGLSSVTFGGGHSSFTSALSVAQDGAAATFDAVVAPMLKRTAPFDAIRLGTSQSPTSVVYQTCAFGPRKPAGVLVNPAVAYETIFGSVGGSATAGRDRSALFDFARTDINTALATFKGNSAERLKLERYLSSLDALLGRESQLAAMSAQVRPFLPPAPATNPLLTMTGGAPDSMKWLEAQFEIATSALLGGLTNNVVLAASTSGFDVHYNVLGGIGRHDLQHGIGAAANWGAIIQITAQHVALIAKLARTLLATPEVNGTGSMLDNTAIVFMSDNGEQHHSEGREWPLLLVGGNAMQLKTDGRTVVYPRDGAANNRQMSNLFNTLGQALGDPTMNMFGDEGPKRVAPGPLSELRA